MTAPTTTRKSYTLPTPCDLRAAHVCRPGFFHCSGCKSDRPRRDFYTSKATGKRVEGRCIECRRARSREVQRLNSPPRMAPPPDVLAPVIAAVAQLPDRQREAVLDFYIKREPTPHTAVKMGITPGGVRQIRYRALASLKHSAVRTLRANRKAVA